MTNYNIVGFKQGLPSLYSDDLSCDIHKGTVLITDPKRKGWLICPECGLPKRKKRKGRERSNDKTIQRVW